MSGFATTVQRYYASGYGRFNTVDPLAASADPKMPQSWNRYGYVLGDPVNGNDPRGMDFPILCDDYDCLSSWAGLNPCVQIQDALFGGSFNCGMPFVPYDPPTAPEPPPPSCSITFANSGTPINGQNLTTLGFVYAPATNTLGPYSNTGSSGLVQGWFNAVQVQATLAGVANPANWTILQTLTVTGTAQGLINPGPVNLTPVPNDNPASYAVYQASGAIDWLDSPGFQANAVVPATGASLSFSFSSSLSDGGATCSVNWSLQLSASPVGYTFTFSK